MNKTIYYSQAGTAYSDKDAMTEAANFMRGEEESTETSNWLFVDVCRAEIAEDMDNLNQLCIVIGNRKYVVNKYGALLDWPDEGFEVYRTFSRIVEGSVNKQRKERGLIPLFFKY